MALARRLRPKAAVKSDAFDHPILSYFLQTMYGRDEVLDAS
jgi:hypothetical protein